MRFQRPTKVPRPFLRKSWILTGLLVIVALLILRWIRLLVGVASRPQWKIAQPVYGIQAVWDKDLQVVYQLPSSSPRGIALVLHACSHSAWKLFAPSSLCPDCIGLSEEMIMVRSRPGSIQSGSKDWLLVPV